jgi:hypothetical protein
VAIQRPRKKKEQEVAQETAAPFDAVFEKSGE